MEQAQLVVHRGGVRVPREYLREIPTADRKFKRPFGATPIPRRATARAAPSARCGSPPARPAARRSATFAGAGQAPQDGVG